RVERGRLAGAVRTDQTEDAPFPDVERDLVERDDASESQRGVLEFEETHARWAGMLRERLLRVEVLLPEVLHRRQARRAHVRGVVGGVVDGSDDEGALRVDVEDVDAAGRLLEAAQERPPTRRGPAEDGAV